MSHEHGSPRDARECAEFLEQIVYLLDDELDEGDQARVRMHLDTCNPCLEKYDLQRVVKAVVARSCHESAPSELRDRVRMRLRQVSIEIREET